MQEIENILDAHLLNESQRNNREQYEQGKEQIKRKLFAVPAHNLQGDYLYYYLTLKNIYV